ncbi:N-myristoyl transferase [Punctularia strigosozonata HHB-11173 SS5]|uniref:N-myristoyl transferase n=1 Tax=Punctularia strigosozonata (strain HHB-11173) TaxID=741275 RepID=UPI000441666E|nr:N-myristoyl transferase [Punctularia strigosozonata HHB-11173 SS5]EIN07254.1 N-myristoyl transferase [Punctularia strigosozonata HHB-11173 SS5]
MSSLQSTQAELEEGAGLAAEGAENEISSGSEAEEVHDNATNQPSTSSSSKKKKKKRSKAAKALQALRPGSNIPQSVVEEVLEKVRAEQGESADVNEETVRQALDQMKIMDVLKGKAGIGGKNRKDAGDHKFWGTQPVPQLGGVRVTVHDVCEEPPLADGYIEPPKPREEVRQEPYPLPKDFTWSLMDISDSVQLNELHELLSGHYVEDPNAAFRFLYSPEFLRWALMPPGYHKEWHIGVRVASNKKLVAFISGVPVTMRVRDNLIHASEINYLCVHKKLRSKRLAPVLIKEVTRQCNLKGIFQAVYTAGVLLPTPVTTCRYFHRSLNVPKLVDVKFMGVPRNMTLARMIRLNKLPTSPHLAGHGLREMEEADVPEVAELYARYMKRFDLSVLMTLDDIRHHLLSGKGTGHKAEPFAGRRADQVTWTYVVENPETHKITDFFSFYFLPSTIIDNPKHNLLEVAYLFYYATDVAFLPDGDSGGRLKKRLNELVGDALIIADQAKFDVFNALTLMDNVDFLSEQKFGQGDGLLNYYLYNWRTSPLAGVNALGDKKIGSGVGLVML